VIKDQIQHVRKRCTRATPVPGAKFRGYQVVLCPSWEERSAVEGKGVLALHVDEAEALLSDLLTPVDKDWLAEQFLRYPNLRLLGVKPQKNDE